MELKIAEEIADQVVEKLKPFCSRIQVAGSIRRHRPFINDVDICLIPSDPWGLNTFLPTMGRLVKNGPLIKRLSMPAAEIDIYVTTLDNWATLLLIRTGSAAHNRYLCGLAKSKGMHLHADGSGLFMVSARGCEDIVETRIAGDTEASIFRSLGLKYKEPQEREK